MKIILIACLCVVFNPLLKAQDNEGNQREIEIVFYGQKFKHPEIWISHHSFEKKKVNLKYNESTQGSGAITVKVDLRYSIIRIIHGSYILYLDLSVYAHRYIYIAPTKEGDIIYIIANTEKMLKIN
jgi:hypothetical protein